MHRLGHEFRPGTNPYKVMAESEKAFDINSSELMRSDDLKTDEEMINYGDSQIQVVNTVQIPLN